MGCGIIAIVGTNTIQQVFTNCKVFNKFGSAIWYIADYLQAKFERLFQVPCPCNIHTCVFVRVDRICFFSIYRAIQLTSEKDDSIWRAKKYSVPCVHVVCVAICVVSTSRP